MKAGTLVLFSLLSFFFLNTLTAHAAWAALGEASSSLEKDRHALHGSLAKVQSQSSDYTIHEISEDGTKIREYVRPDGKVFAVTWRGVSEPDLSVLFGKYFNEYQDALASNSRIKRRSRAMRVMNTENLRIERAGHMRDVRGAAYVKNLVPEGVNPAELPR